MARKLALVGNPGWVGFDHERILDGRSTEAKRFQFIVSADIFESAVQPDWSGFLPNDPAWEATRPAVHAQIKEYLSTFSADRRREAKHTVREHLVKTVRLLPPVGRERWSLFVDEVIDNCPSISTEEVGKVAGILANLELSTSKFGLVGKLHELQPGDLDALYELLDDWTLRLAMLDEIQTRLKLIEDLDKKLRDETMDEVGDLQPLFERSLWVFGPEFESLEFTSNKGMTEVIRKIFGSNDTGRGSGLTSSCFPTGASGFIAAMRMIMATRWTGFLVLSWPRSKNPAWR